MHWILGDLTISVYVLYNYLEVNAKVPWEDLRYLFGEIMYGGHITDDWDRRLCKTYLQEFMHPDMVRHNKAALFVTYKYTGQVGLGVGSWPSNRTNAGSPPSEFDYTS